MNRNTDHATVNYAAHFSGFMAGARAALRTR